MKRMFVVLGLISSMAATSAQAASDCPFPKGVQASIGASRAAVEARQAGIKKEALLAKISPQTDGDLYPTLKSIVDEVYDYPPLRPEVYGAYRFERCFVSQQHADKVAAINFAEVHPLLKKCEEITPEDARPRCAMGVVHSVTGIPE